MNPQAESELTQSYYYPLFDHMSRSHNLTLLDSEMREIVDVVKTLKSPAEKEEK